MKSTPAPAVASLSWFDANQRYLALSMARVRSFLESSSPGEPPSPGAPAKSPARRASPAKAVDTSPAVELRALAEAMPAPPAIESLSTIFGLSAFERDLLLLCAGFELDSQFSGLMASQNAPTFSLALAVLPEAHWSALTPAAPLRRWRLVEVGAGQSMTQAPLRIDESILHFLAGTGYVDDRLNPYVEGLPAARELVPSHQTLAGQIAATWSSGTREEPLPVIQLCGPDASARRQVAASGCAMLGLGLGAMRASAIPASPVEVDALMRLWERQAVLANQALLLDCDDTDAGPLRRWIESARFPLLLTARERLATAASPGGRGVTLEVHKPTPAEQRQLWRQSLGEEAAGRLNGRLELITSHFDLDADSIAAITAETLNRPPEGVQDLGDALWSACRARSHPRLGELAQHIQPMAGWEDLVLPAAQIQTLREVAVHVRQRMKVYESWGFAGKSARGLGISALFAGVSGTGKTMAAEVLANELQLDLYRIDLSQVVNKYIGETEKNLRRVFDAAEEGGAILLFDEADALFGKRSDVKDSHDRYANVEVSYLLQRMEAYRGLAILTTNLKEAIDTAFMRRIRFVVQFPFPDAAQRTEIWRRIFPSQTPTEGLDLDRLSRLSVAGGNIRNIALSAAFLAADSNEPVRMNHLLRAARVEYTKLEKPLSEAEIGGWS